MKLWSGRFKKTTDELVDTFTASISFDYVLAEVDIQGSLAHVKMLNHIGLITSDEHQKIHDGLLAIIEDIKNDRVTFSINDEDIHLNIERLLHEKIGEVAGKLHSGRSRNDQVALDLHLYMRHEITQLVAKLQQLQIAITTQAQQHLHTILPGYTHLQRAQPVRLAHHWLAYNWMLQRDIERLMECWQRVNVSPLGAGAIAGAGFNIDRQYVANELGFAEIYQNSMDAVSDRDFIIEFLADASMIMLHLSRLSEELILWSSQEFNFIELDDAFCTGSSMMPQKKNPDVPELVRGKTGRVFGALFSLLTVMKGLPLTYNKDLQEDKEGLFDTLKTLHYSLDIFTPLMASIHVNTENMQNAAVKDYANATALADYLVNKGLPFRQAHEVVGQLVLHCIEKNSYLGDLSLQDYQTFSSLITEDVYPILQLEHVVEERNVVGGTSLQAVRVQLKKIQQKIQLSKDWLAAR